MIVGIAILVLIAFTAVLFLRGRLSRRTAGTTRPQPQAFIPERQPGPAADAGAPPPEPASKPDPAQKGALPCGVLIADDQRAIRMLLRELLELGGLTVYEASNGRSAIEQARNKGIGFILLDLKMPDMDGIEVLEAIRAFRPDVKVAMITASSDPDKQEAANRLGVRAFFTKPFDIEYVKSFVISELGG
ncbi:response regulator [Paenibacillus humicola]|uniref:response regulator n=1 Tax=Paenibacillus humicola TaxID=3110540 RepID=UPI00237C2F78|nr:response regulator [Paenibacillus humicola]